MKYLDRIEAGCNVIIKGTIVATIIDTVVGESGSKYFICDVMGRSGVNLYKLNELERPFVWEEGEPYGVDKSNA